MGEKILVVGNSNGDLILQIPHLLSHIQRSNHFPDRYGFLLIRRSAHTVQLSKEISPLFSHFGQKKSTKAF